MYKGKRKGFNGKGMFSHQEGAKERKHIDHI